MSSEKDTIRVIAREVAEEVCADHMEMCEARRQIEVNPTGHSEDHGFVSFYRINWDEWKKGLFQKTLWILFIAFVSLSAAIIWGYFYFKALR